MSFWQKIPKKEKGLIKGALRRVFSRSELRQNAIARNEVEHYDEKRPRVTKWVWCDECGVVFPRYTADCDHLVPLVPLDRASDDLSPNELVERLWCDISNLQTLCKGCHNRKTKFEAKLRREHRKKVNDG